MFFTITLKICQDADRLSHRGCQQWKSVRANRIYISSIFHHIEMSFSILSFQNSSKREQHMDMFSLENSRTRQLLYIVLEKQGEYVVKELGTKRSFLFTVGDQNNRNLSFWIPHFQPQNFEFSTLFPLSHIQINEIMPALSIYI